ncbi:MAG: bifunctional 4-hydroxy-2-oxoglutarate aldolase/2-dehydro-3-deoxy-phosphogluconate aldolase [Pseudomonadota bacterium]
MPSSDPVLARLTAHRVIPVITIEDVATAPGLARALIAGGLPVAEITLRTPAGADAIRAMRKAAPDLLVGAGTVLTPDQAATARDAGAAFLISPGLSDRTVGWAQDHGLPIVPGTCTPGDIERALGFGLDTVKFFPAEAYGGVRTIKALSGPYHDVRFVPTGGITPDNLRDYLALPGVLACGGSWMVPVDMIAAADWGRIGTLARQAVALAKD